MAKVQGKQIVGTGFPTEEGAKLASKLIELGDASWSELEVDLHDLPSALLISPFFNGVLQAIYDFEPKSLDQARKIKWLVTYDFQKENIATWMKTFKPVVERATA